MKGSNSTFVVKINETSGASRQYCGKSDRSIQVLLCQPPSKRPPHPDPLLHKCVEEREKMREAALHEAAVPEHFWAHF
jgi:hypothetical protein